MAVTQKVFKKLVWDHYLQNKRPFAWRETTDTYRILVSEVMLQQTQTYRVEPKFDAFIATFPTAEHLAKAPFPLVLSLWKGLGYNRRARSLQLCAQVICEEYGGIFPTTVAELKALPGIGEYTANAVLAFAYNRPQVFIETNIRAVYLHHFFSDQSDVHDKELFPLIEKTVDKSNPREWYYALMDYGVALKKLHKNPSRKSKHHTTQSKFEGSNRQIRGMILQVLLDSGSIAIDQLYDSIPREVERIEKALDQLITDKLIQTENGKICLVA